MYHFVEQISSNKAVLRMDVFGGPQRESIVEDDTFLNYRLAAVEVSSKITKEKADIIWNYDASPKDIRFEDGQLILDGFWEEGELNKIMVSMLANEMDLCGLHPFHSSSVFYRGKMILIVGGENNHGKSMTQLEGCVRGGKIFSTETTVTDEDGLCLYGSKHISITKRAKGTERSDVPDQDMGVKIFFGGYPDMPHYNDQCKVDLAIVPAIDGHFITQVKPLGTFEAAYQTFHSLMNFFGMSQLLEATVGLAMPIVDTPERRAKRALFTKKFVQDIPYYLIRSKSPQVLFDEIDKIIDAME